MGRAPCCDKDGLKKGPWLPEEDQKLIDYIQVHGPGNWRNLPKKAGLQRCGKSCRLRWTNYLRPDIKRGRFSFEEEETIIQLHSMLGNKWSAIAAKLPGRTDNEIKNYWNTHIRKRLLRMGIDPVTHTRRLDLVDLPSIIMNSQLQNLSQFNLLKLFGLQSLVNQNPHLLRLATLLSTNQTENLNILLQNLAQSSIHNPFSQMQNHFNGINPVQNGVHTSYNPISDNTQVVKSNFEQNPEVISGFDEHKNVLFNSKDSIQEGENALPSDDEAFLNHLLENPAFMCDNSNQNMSIPYVFSSPCSSQQTPLSSNSVYHNSSSSSSEDETDSYCENLLNFDIPVDLFDVGRSC